MSSKDTADFEQRWSQLSFDQKSSILRDAFEELCIENHMPVPDLDIFPGLAINPRNDDGFIYGDRDPVSGQVRIFGDSPNPFTGEPQFAEPWQAINSIGHEFTHYFTDAQGLQLDPATDEAIAQLGGDAIEREWRERYDTWGEQGPEPHPLVY